MSAFRLWEQKMLIYWHTVFLILSEADIPESWQQAADEDPEQR